jgi:cytochrome P450
VKTLFDTEVREKVEAIGHAMELAQTAAIARTGSAIWIPEWFPTKTHRSLHRAMRVLDELIYGFIAERRRSEARGKDLLSMLVEATDEEDGAGMSDKQLRDEAMTLFLAGHETTALALTWAFYLLAQNPEAERRLA